MTPEQLAAIESSVVMASDFCWPDEQLTEYAVLTYDNYRSLIAAIREATKNGVDSGWGSMTLARRIEAVQSPSRFVKTTIQQTFALVNHA